MHIEKEKFGKTKDGEDVIAYTVKNNNGVELTILNYGGIIQKLLVPDKNGKQRDVVLGYKDFQHYEKPNVYMGGIIGRSAHRVRSGRLNLNGRQILLSQNEGANHFHGGYNGFNKVIWEASDVCRDTDHGVELKYTSPDGEEGYPGTLMNVVTITLSDFNEIKFNFHSTSSKTTVINLSHTSFFNLNNGGKDSILDHELQIFSNSYTPVLSDKTPSGEIVPLNPKLEIFKELNPIKEFIDQNDISSGLDHNLIVEKFQDIAHMASLKHSGSGIQMKVYGTQPCLQVYSAQEITSEYLGKENITYKPFSALCLEGQEYPDSLNHENFKKAILKPTEIYNNKFQLAFSVK